MQVIIKGVTNPLCISANEKVTLANPNYLFVFKHKTQNINIPCILVNTSTYDRYDLFSFIEGTSATLKYTGEYVMRVYEQTSAINTNPTDSSVVGMVHIEQCLVLKEPIEIKEHNPTITRSIYEFS